MRTPSICIITILLSNMLLFSSVCLHGQVCSTDLIWIDHLGAEIPTDLSYFSVSSNPLDVNGQLVTITNEASPGNAASEYNHTIYAGAIGAVEHPYVMSINGSSSGSIHYAMKFHSTVFDVQMTLLDIDRNQDGFWQDYVSLKVYSGAFKINLTTENILSIGEAVTFYDSNDHFGGNFEVNNADEVYGNVSLSFPGAIDSIIIDYTFGPLSTNMDGLQIIGIDNVNFKSTYGCNVPMAIDDMFCEEVSSTAHILDVLSNDVQGTGTIDLSTIEIITKPTKGTASVNSTNGNISFTANSNFAGIDSIEYKICDSNDLCAQAWAYVLLSSDLSSFYTIDDHYALLSNGQIRGNILQNDIQLSASNVSVNTSSLLTTQNGDLKLDTDGSFSYYPNKDFEGTDLAIVMVCNDATPNVCKRTFIEFVVKPIVIPGAYSVVDFADEIFTYKNKSYEMYVNTNLSHIGAEGVTYFYSMLTVPINGSANITSDGFLSFTPKYDYVGEDYFSYERTNLLTNHSEEVHVSVNIINEYMNCDFSLPIALDDLAFGCENQSVSGNVLQNDSANSPYGSSAVVSLVSGVSNGSLVLNAMGNYTYFPTTDFWGTDEFTYEVCFYSNEIDKTTESHISADVPKTLPIGASTIYSGLTTSGEGQIINIEVNNVIIDHANLGEVSLKLHSPSGQSIYLLKNVCANNKSMNINFADKASQSVISCPPSNGATYKPVSALSKFNTEDINGTWFLQIIDNNINANGGVLKSWELNITTSVPQLISCRNANVKVLVMPKVKAPNALDDCAETIVNKAVVFNPLSNDTDDDGDIDISSFEITIAPSHGIVTKNIDGSYLYTPDSDFTGTDYFSYTICDDTKLCSTAEIKVVVATLLAIKYSVFDVKLVNNRPMLTWIVNDDHDVDYFEIERKTLAGFESISSVEADKNTSYFSYADKNLSQSGVIYYRVKSVNFEGESSYTDIKSIEMNSDSDVKVYPNPFNNYFIVDQISDSESVVNMQLFNNIGAMVYQTQISGQTQIDLDHLNLQSGMYVVKILTEEWERAIPMIKH